MKKQIIVASILSFLLLSGCNQDAASNDSKITSADKKTIEKTTTSKTNENKEDVIQQVKIDGYEVAKIEGDDGFCLDLKVPRISGMTHKKNEDYLNHEFLNFAEQLKAQVLEVEETMKKDPSSKESGIHANAVLDFSIKQQNKHIFSILLYGNIYTGGAHGMDIKLTYVYDLEQDKLLTLSDLFEQEDDVLKLTPYLLESIEQSRLSELMFDDFERVRYNQPFYLTEDTLVIVFEHYEYTAGVAGAPEIPIKKSSLDFLKEEFK